jgi:hypothetical protein
MFTLQVNAPIWQGDFPAARYQLLKTVFGNSQFQSQFALSVFESFSAVETKLQGMKS